MLRIFLAVTLTLAVAGGSAAGEPTAIDLGGPRRATAALSVTATEYVVAVKMFPVSSFDAATNARLNRDKARALALQALAKHLSGAKAVTLSVSGAEVEGAGADGKFYALTLRVPRRSVSVVAAGRPPEEARPVEGKAEKVERVDYTSALFTRKQDLLDTLAGLSVPLAADLDDAARTPDGRPAGEGAFHRAVAEVEERGLGQLDKLAAEVDGEILLLSIEKAELNRLIGEQRVRLLASLKNRLDRFDTTTKGANKP